MSNEFANYEAEIEKHSEKDFKVAAEAQRILEQFRQIMGILRARNYHKKTKTNWLIEHRGLQEQMK